MGFRFRKSVKILPGVRVNVTGKGVSSVSVGGKGARVNLGKKRNTVTTSLPGTGLSYSRSYSKNLPAPLAEKSQHSFWVWVLVVLGCSLLLTIIFG